MKPQAQGPRSSSPQTGPRGESQDKPEAAERDEKWAHSSGSDASILSPSACLRFPARPTGRNLAPPAQAGR